MACCESCASGGPCGGGGLGHAGQWVVEDVPAQWVVKLPMSQGLRGSPGALGDGSALATTLCDRLFPGNSAAARAANATCKAAAANMNVAQFCNNVPQEVRAAALLAGVDVGAACRDLVGGGGSGGEHPYRHLSPGDEIPNPNTSWAGADQRDIRDLRHRLSFNVELTRRLYPDKVAAVEQRVERCYAEGVPEGLSNCGQIQSVVYTQGDARDGKPDHVWFGGTLPSGFRLFFVTGSRKSRQHIASMTGVVPVDGDYLVALQSRTMSWTQHPNGTIYYKMKRLREGSDEGDRYTINYPTVIAVPRYTPLPTALLERADDSVFDFDDVDGGSSKSSKKKGSGIAWAAAAAVVAKIANVI